MKYLINIATEDGTLQVWAETESVGRMACNLLAPTPGVVRVELFRVKTMALLATWG